jgi:hypothetical protein
MGRPPSARGRGRRGSAARRACTGKRPTTGGRRAWPVRYLLDPPLPELSVKVRRGRALEVKAYRGSPGILEVAGRARGRMESWQKWSFPLARPAGGRYAKDGASAGSH